MSLITVAIAVLADGNRLWWFDPAGAVFISIVIIYRWGSLITEQVMKIVGHTAPPVFYESITDLALAHDPRLSVDCVRAYYAGSRCKYTIVSYHTHDLIYILHIIPYIPHT